MMNSIYVTERDSDTLHEGFHDFWRLPQFSFIAGKLTWHQQQNRTILAQAVLEKKNETKMKFFLKQRQLNKKNTTAGCYQT